MTSNVATVTVNITGAAPPPPTTGETIVVSSANYRGDQLRWTVNGTETLQAGQLVNIVNIGSTTAVKNVLVGQAVVPAGGAWTLDIRGVASSLVPSAGDRVIAVNTNTNVKSQPVNVAIR